jgi:hypothetical protein
MGRAYCADAAQHEMVRAARELNEQGTNHYAERAISDTEAAATMRQVKRVPCTN